MKSLLFTVYLNGRAGLSNLIMSFELGVVLARLTDRVLILKGNHTPTGNVVRYDGMLGNVYPSRVTDLIDLPVPWIDSEAINLAALAPHEICEGPAWESVFYFPPDLSTKSDDFRSFAGRRSNFITIGDDLQTVPSLSFSGGTKALTLSFYSYFMYLDQAAQQQAFDALQQMRPKRELANFAARIVEELGPFNAVHVRRGDFKQTFGVTTLDRTPAEAIATFDHHFGRDERLLILTDEADDPFFEPFRTGYRDCVFLDRYILENHRSGFLDLPRHDSVALAFLSQLVAAESRDFVGSMTSTFTALIQRMRGNRAKLEPFKFLWNELPDPGDEVARGRHRIGTSVPMDKGIMVEERAGPYSWNRYNERLNPAWMREWPESLLDEPAMLERARGRESVSAPRRSSRAAEVPSRISFLANDVVVSSNDAELARSISDLYALMLSKSDGPSIANVRIAIHADHAELMVDGVTVETGRDGSRLLRRCYREVVSRFIHRFPDLVWLHAGCAGTELGAVVLPGDWGRGKSSLVLALSERGYTYLSDDVAPIDPADATVLPFPATLQIRASTTPELPRDRLGELVKSSVAMRRDQVALGPQPISMIVFPHFRKAASAELVAVSPGQAVGELLENCLSLPQNQDVTIQRLCAIVETLPVYRLTFGHEHEAASLLMDKAARVNGVAAG